MLKITKNKSNISRTVVKKQAGYLDCGLDESYVKKLLGYFKQRA